MLTMRILENCKHYSWLVVYWPLNSECLCHSKPEYDCTFTINQADSLISLAQHGISGCNMHCIQLNLCLGTSCAFTNQGDSESSGDHNIGRNQNETQSST